MDEISIRLENIRTWWNELHYTPLQKRALAFIAVAVIALSGIYIARGNSQEIVNSDVPVTIDVAQIQLYVDVAGGVAKPGVYKLQQGARVIDAVRAAGGAIKGADSSDINLARLLKDGEQIYIYPPQKAGVSTSHRTTVRASRPTGPVAVNRATAKEFEALDGIGPVLANRIVAYRKTNGPFASVDDLLKVAGIGPSKFAQFKSKLRV